MKVSDLAGAMDNIKDLSWYQHLAWLAYMSEAYRIITSRHDRDEVYMLRFWINPPVKSDEPDGDIYQARNSLLLHWILKPDDSDSLHDHPWPFLTTILSGGYDEIVPPTTWNGKALGRGPMFLECIRNEWLEGARICRRADEAHAIAYVKADTWTLVKTGPRERNWGFWPENELWKPWRDHLRDE